MKKVKNFALLLCIGCGIWGCSKKPISPIEICLNNIKLDIIEEDAALPFDQSEVELSSPGLKYFNPEPPYGDRILIDGEVVPSDSFDHTYLKSTVIAINIPGRTTKALSLGRLEVKVDLQAPDSRYYCDELVNKLEPFCYLREVKLLTPSARHGEVITLEGQFSDTTDYRIRFFGNNGEIVEDYLIADQGKELKVTVPKRPFNIGNNLSQPVHVEVLKENGQPVCSVEADQLFTYEYTYMASRFFGSRGNSAADCGACPENCPPGGCPEARFFYPRGLAIDQLGNVYVSDSGGKMIWKIGTSDGGKTHDYPCRVAGTCRTEESPDERCQDFYMNNMDNSHLAKFSSPAYLAVDDRDMQPKKLFASEDHTYSGKHWLIREIDLDEDGVSSYAGTCYFQGSQINLGESACKKEVSFLSPQGLAIDRDGLIYLADHNQDAIFRISPPPNDMDCGMAEFIAIVDSPRGLHLGGSSSSPVLYIAGKDRILMINLSAGNIPDDVLTNRGRLTGITGDQYDNLYTIDESTNSVILMPMEGNPRELAIQFEGNDIMFEEPPQDLAYDKNNNTLFIADTESHIVWKILIE